MLTVVITPNTNRQPIGKVADVELHFVDGPLQGLMLIGFSVWESRRGGPRNVCFPARSYAVIRELILNAYTDHAEAR